MGKTKKSKNRKIVNPNAGSTLPLATREIIAGQVLKLAEPLCEDEGLELVHVEFVIDGFFNVLRVYIDRPDGISMEDCAAISRQLGDIIDVSVSVNAEYRLEVSSPGIFRHIYKKEDYNKFCGKTIKIQTELPIDGQRKFKGILKGISEDGIVEISIDDNPLKMDYASITRAQLTEDNGDDRC